MYIAGSENSFSQRKRFFNEFFIPASGNELSVKWKRYSFILSSFEDFKIRVEQPF